MASNLRVDNIQPSTAMGIGIGTANGSVTFNADVTGGLNVTSGSVGIGTSNPTQDLEIQDDTLPTVIVRNRTSSSYSRVLLDEVGDTGGGFTINRLGSTSSAIGGARAGQIWNHANAPIVFGTNDTEAARFTAAGNLAFVSGTGIDFSATSDGSGTTTSEIFDDYEEGSWTPTLTNGYTYTTLTARYTKIGNVVYIYCNFYRNDSGTYTSDLEVTNLPFDMGSYTNSMGLGVADSYNGTSDRRHGHINSNNSNSVKVIKDGTTAFVSYDNFVVNSRNLTMKWWYYTA